MVCLHEFVPRFINRQSRDTAVSVSGQAQVFLVLHGRDVI